MYDFFAFNIIKNIIINNIIIPYSRGKKERGWREGANNSLRKTDASTDHILEQEQAAHVVPTSLDQGGRRTRHFLGLAKNFCEDI